MTSWTIVAVPSHDSPVWKLSSEKIPHMTLLYFGEQIDEDLKYKIAGFLKHAVDFSLVHEFGLDVTDRGELGDQGADVLYLGGDNLKDVENFRDSLLQDSNVKAAYESVDQFPSWTPHLTLGYPENPVKEYDYPPPGHIIFDKIMFWTEDFGGLEMRLQDRPLEHQDTNDFLSHYGVKGMKWGARRSQAALDRNAGRKETKTKKKVSRATKKAQKQYDKNVEKNWHKAYNEGARQANKLVPKLNEKYKDYDFSDLSDPGIKKVHEQYVQEFNDLSAPFFEKSYNEMFGERPGS